MKDRVKKLLVVFTASIAFISAVCMTVIGNATEGLYGVVLSLSGLGLILILLYFYNRSYK